MRPGNNFGNNCRGRGRGRSIIGMRQAPYRLFAPLLHTLCTYTRTFLRHCQFVSCLGTLYFFRGWGVGVGNKSNGQFRVHKRPPLDPTLTQNTSVHYKYSDAQFLTKVSEEMVSFGSQICVTLTCCSMQFADLIVTMKTLYCEHFLSYLFKCWYDYCHTYSKLHITRNILYTPSFNIPSLTWNIALANKEVIIACLLLCYQHSVNNALNCLSRELFKCIAEEWRTFCRSRKCIQKGVRMRYTSVWIYGLKKRKMGPTILVALTAHHTPTLTSHNDIPCEPPT